MPIHGTRARTQIACVCRNGDRRRLFRGWSRLCLHAASLCVAEAEEAATTATARATRADAMEREAAAAIAAADVASRKRRRAEMAEHDEQRQRINEAKRLVIPQIV